MSAKRLIWLDSLRLIAGLSMVALHSTADPNGQAWPDYETAERIAPLILRAVVYIARTELFLIISVFLLIMALDRRPRSYLDTLKEQVRRLLLPFSFWTVFYAFYGLIKANAFGYAPSAWASLMSPSEWLGFFLLGDVKYHMHFLPTLFGLLLFYPLFRLAQKFPILGLSIIGFLVIRRELDTFLYAHFWQSEHLPYLLRMVKILTYAGYGMFAGAMVGIWQRGEAGVLRQWFPFVVFLASLLFLMKLTATWKSIELGRWVFEDTAGYWADFLMPALLFAGCLTIGYRSWPSTLSKLAPYSFGIYLCHPIFLDLCEIALRGANYSPIYQVLSKISLALVGTSIFVNLLSKKKLLAWTIGLGPLPSIGLQKHRIKESHR